jgi:hypothetical protein
VSAKILQFAPLTETDINALAGDLLFNLAMAADIDPKILVRTFREAHPDLKPIDLINAVNLSIKILMTFQKLVLKAEYEVEP